MTLKPYLQTAFVLTDAFIKHITGVWHPESPKRYIAIEEKLKSEGLLHKENILNPRKATFQELLLCHTEDYIHLVEEEIKTCREMNLYDGSYTLLTGDTQICPDSLDAALLAVGGVLDGIDAVMEGRFSNVFSLGRPPGHHACSNRGMGFCLFNQIAIGARYAKEKYGLNHILIADWDVHHGNGTQEIFEEDPSVFYFSTHQWPFYPGTGAASERGKGPGFGTILNCPITASPNSRNEVLDAFQNVLVKEMEKFQPELVFISAGFDAHEKDPIGSFNLTVDDFRELTKIMKKIAHAYASGRIISALEGGYNLEALAASACAHSQELAKK